MGLFSKKKWYIVVWAYEKSLSPYTDIVKAKSAPEAGAKIRKQHALPIFIQDIREVIENGKIL